MLGVTLILIKENLLAALSGITSVEGRITYGDAIPGLALPNITVNVPSESLDYESAYMKYSDDPYERSLDVVIEARALLRDGTEVPIDDLCWEIENAIKAYAPLYNVARDLRLSTTTYQLEEDALPVGLATIEYVGYYLDHQTTNPGYKPGDDIHEYES